MPDKIRNGIEVAQRLFRIIGDDKAGIDVEPGRIRGLALNQPDIAAGYLGYHRVDRLFKYQIDVKADHRRFVVLQQPANDLALGRIIETVSKSPQWKNTAIFVIEDDAQAGPDHVDGHRTVFACYSPYVKRGFVDSNFYTTVTMLATIEKMLGLDPMNKFDANTPPMAACFTDTPNFTAFSSVPNRTKIGEMNTPRTALAPSEKKWYDLSASLDWSEMDAADYNTLNRVLWHNLHGDKPYPTP